MNFLIIAQSICTDVKSLGDFANSHHHLIPEIDFNEQVNTNSLLSAIAGELMMPQLGCIIDFLRHTDSTVRDEYIVFDSWHGREID